MALRVLLLHVGIGQVGIHLGGGYAGVTQELLHVTEGGPVLEQVSGEAVPQSMGRDVLGNARLLGVGL